MPMNLQFYLELKQLCNMHNTIYGDYGLDIYSTHTTELQQNG